MARKVQPEILDSLTPDHPDALHNRRDLRLTNRAMGNHRWLVRILPRYVQPQERVLEIGAGTGELIARLARQGVTADGLDLWPAPDDWPPGRTWHRGDLRSFSRYADYAVIFGNLVFHQFTDGELADLGAKLRASARLIVACEPARSRRSQFLYRVLGPLFGANHVSLHDAHVSIAAGFRDDELPRALGLTTSEWDISCSRAPIGSYHLIAHRR